MSDNKSIYEAYAHEIFALYNSFKYVGFTNDIAFELTKLYIENQPIEKQSTDNNFYAVLDRKHRSVCLEEKENKTSKLSNLKNLATLKNMLDFKVYYDDGDYCGVSKVYAVDTVKDRFLICDTSTHFRWISTNDCILEEDEEIDLG